MARRGDYAWLAKKAETVDLDGDEGDDLSPELGEPEEEDSWENWDELYDEFLLTAPDVTSSTSASDFDKWLEDRGLHRPSSWRPRDSRKPQVFPKPLATKRVITERPRYGLRIVQKGPYAGHLVNSQGWLVFGHKNKEQAVAASGVQSESVSEELVEKPKLDQPVAPTQSKVLWKDFYQKNHKPLEESKKESLPVPNAAPKSAEKAARKSEGTAKSDKPAPIKSAWTKKPIV